MPRQFAIKVRGAIPADLAKRVAQVHAAAIEARQRLVPPDPTGQPRPASRLPRSPRPQLKA